MCLTLTLEGPGASLVGSTGLECAHRLLGGGRDLAGGCLTGLEILNPDRTVLYASYSKIDCSEFFRM